MVGGADSAVQRVQPLLDAMAGHAPVVGPAPGDGQKVKLVNQLLCGVHIAAAAEALALAYAEALGLGAAATWQVIREGAAESFMLNDRGERMVQPSDEGKSALDIFVKDMGLVLDAGRATSFPSPLRIRRRTVIPRRTPGRTRPSRRLLGDRSPARQSGASVVRGPQIGSSCDRPPGPQIGVVLDSATGQSPTR